MNNIVTIEGKNLDSIEAKAREKYGDRYQIHKVQSVKDRTFLGKLFGREIVEAELIISTKGKSVPNRNLSSQNNEEIEIPSSLFVSDSERYKKEQEKILSNLTSSKENKTSLETNILLDEIKKVRDSIEKSKSASGFSCESLEKLNSILEENDFSKEYREEITCKIEQNLSATALKDYKRVLDEASKIIEQNCLIDEMLEKPDGSGAKVIILVGPTGVGKTTTIAKLGANLKLAVEAGEAEPKITFITTDFYRAAAIDQLKNYSDLLEVELVVAKNAKDLEKQILFHSDSDYILVDTFGKEPKDRELFSNLRELLEKSSKRADIYLTLDALKKEKDLLLNINSFDIFQYRAIILTKFDGTQTVGNVLSALNKSRKKIAYITTGQAVPNDIEVASRELIFSKLEDFKIGKGN